MKRIKNCRPVSRTACLDVINPERTVRAILLSERIIVGIATTRGKRLLVFIVFRAFPPSLPPTLTNGFKFVLVSVPVESRHVDCEVDIEKKFNEMTNVALEMLTTPFAPPVRSAAALGRRMSTPVSTSSDENKTPSETANAARATFRTSAITSRHVTRILHTHTETLRAANRRTFRGRFYTDPRSSSSPTALFLLRTEISFARDAFPISWRIFSILPGVH